MDGLAHAAVAAAPPAVPVRQLERAVQQQFGLNGEYAPLVSERDQNFQLTAPGGDEYIVKVTSLAEPPSVSEFQIAALRHLELRDVLVPSVIETREGGHTATVSYDGQDYRLRVVSYLPGAQLASQPVTSELAKDFGARLAELDTALQDFTHPGENPVLLWDLQRAGELQSLQRFIDDDESRHRVARALKDFEKDILPCLGELREQVIHGDANPGNVLIDPSGRRVTGFIDFGDMLRAPLVFDVAIAAAYLRGGDTSPLASITPFVAAYNEVCALRELERALLFDLIRTRLATTITLLFWRLSARHPDDPYRAKTLSEEADAMRFLGVLDSLGRSEFNQQLARNEAWQKAVI